MRWSRALALVAVSMPSFVAVADAFPPPGAKHVYTITDEWELDPDPKMALSNPTWQDEYEINYSKDITPWLRVTAKEKEAFRSGCDATRFLLSMETGKGLAGSLGPLCQERGIRIRVHVSIGNKGCCNDLQHAGPLASKPGEETFIAVDCDPKRVPSLVFPPRAQTMNARPTRDVSAMVIVLGHELAHVYQATFSFGFLMMAGEIKETAPIGLYRDPLGIAPQDTSLTEIYAMGLDTMSCPFSENHYREELRNLGYRFSWDGGAHTRPIEPRYNHEQVWDTPAMRDVLAALQKHGKEWRIVDSRKRPLYLDAQKFVDERFPNRRFRIFGPAAPMIRSPRP